MQILPIEQQYLLHLDRLLSHGRVKQDRTGTGTTSIFGHQMRCDLRDGFPLLTTKQVHLKSIIYELLWFLNGDTNVKFLQANGVKIWNEWADENGDLGPIYGKQWRAWDGMLKFQDGTEIEAPIDQIANVIERLKTNPDCRRLIVNAWNVGELDTMALAPCHCLFQFYTEEMTQMERTQWAITNLNREIVQRFHETAHDRVAPFLDAHHVPRRFLSCQLYQRSADWFLGVPFNIASYALLTMMMAREVNMVAKDFVHTFGDSHLYLNHIEQAETQLERTPTPGPHMRLIDRDQSLFDYRYEDFELQGYAPHPPIKAPVAV